MDKINDRFPAGLLERYELVESLSGNEEKAVAIVKRKSDGERFVAKVYRSDAMECGTNEADMLARFDHAGIPRLIETQSDERVCWLVREYVEGQTLAQYAEERALSEREIIDIAIRLCGVLGHLHSSKPPVIHRDVTPRNIIINDKEVWLIDFGISRRFSRTSQQDTVFAGTVSYAPPEQYGFMQTDRRSDVYSLGAVMRSLCGEHTSDERLERIIERCLSFSPSKRYRSVESLKRELEGLKPAVRRRRTLFSISMAAGIVLLVFLAGIFLLKQPADRPAVVSESQTSPTTRQIYTTQDENSLLSLDNSYIIDEDYLDGNSGGLIDRHIYQQGDNIYYISLSEMYRISVDGSECEKLFPDMSNHSILGYEDKLAIVSSDPSEIERFQVHLYDTISGEDVILIMADEQIGFPSPLCMDQDWVYCFATNTSREADFCGDIYRISHDGTTAEIIFSTYEPSQTSYIAQLYNGKLYASVLNYGLVCMNTDGTAAEILTPHEVNLVDGFVIIDDRIIYCNCYGVYSDHGVYSADLSFEDITTYYSGNCMRMLVLNDMIYYSPVIDRPNDVGSMYGIGADIRCVPVSGGETKTLYTSDCLLVGGAGNWLYFQQWTESQNTCRMRLDGTGFMEMPQIVN